MQISFNSLASLNVGLSFYTLFFCAFSALGANMLYLQWFLFSGMCMGGVFIIYKHRLIYLCILKDWEYRSFLKIIILNSFLIIGVILLGYIYLLIGYNHPIESVSGMGNWGYKAKLIYTNYGIPQDYIENHATLYGKFTYPNSFPSLNASLCMFRGAWDENLVRLNSIVLMLAAYSLVSFTFINKWRWKGILMPICTASVFLAPSAYQVTDALYAEPLLLFQVTSACIFYVDRKFILALLCAFSAAWVKQEGILFCLLLSFAILVSEKDKMKHLLFSLSLGFLFILFWKIFTLQLSDSDFSLTQPNMMNFYKSLNHLNKVLQNDWPFYIFQCVFGIIGWVYFSKNKQVFTLWLISTMLVIIYLLSMIYSQINIDWHLTSLERYLMTPSLILVIAMSAALIPEIKTSSRDDITN